LSDVTAPTPTSGDFLKWNGTAWVNDPINLGTDTVGNYMSDLTQGTGVTITHTPGEASNATIAIGQAVGTSSSVQFAAITAPLIGNASTATTLQSARTIAGQSFDGSANISIAPTDLTGVTSTAAELNILDGATLSTTELNYVDGVTSAIQTQLNDKAPSAGPTFTGTVVLPSTTSIGTVDSTEIGYLDGVTSALQTQLNAKAPVAGPTFTGTVVLPSTTSIGNVTSTEIGYVDGVTSAIQTQLNAKAPIESPTFTGNVTQEITHGLNAKLRLSAANNGAATGECSLYFWISEPAATWTGAGIARNRVNTSGSFPRVNTGLSGQYIRLDEGGNTFFSCMNSAGSEAIFVFDPGGTASKSGGGSWAVYSDIRLKENIHDYEKGTAELMQLRVCEWEHNGKGGLQQGSKGIGVVADEVELILPDTVSTYNAKLNPEDEETTDIKRFDSSEITWLLVKTVQEQQAKIEALTARLEALES
jgi:hypothetical protein